MANWTAFAGFTGVVVVLFLLLARASQSMITHDDPVARREDLPGFPTEADGEEGATPVEPVPADGVTDDDVDDTTVDFDEVTVEPAGTATRAEQLPASDHQFGTGELLANVLLTHGLFALLVAGTAVYWAVPAGALGVGPPTLPAVAWGVLVGVALYAGDELGAAGLDRVGVGHDETLRELLAPSTPGGWALLLGVVLPTIAIGEELLFRGVLVGAYAVGLGLPAWGLAVVSSVAFALGHGAQGRAGVVVTGLLGFVLAAAFVVSGSLLLVVVAHYVVNALEFVVHEGLGVEWAG